MLKVKCKMLKKNISSVTYPAFAYEHFICLHEYRLWKRVQKKADWSELFRVFMEIRSKLFQTHGLHYISNPCVWRHLVGSDGSSSRCH
jgi:hypothetical protein